MAPRRRCPDPESPRGRCRGAGLERFVQLWWHPARRRQSDGSKFVLSWWYETHLFDATSGELINTPGLPLVVSTVSRNGVGAGSTADGRVLLFDPNTLATLAELPGGLHGYAEFLDISDDGSTLVVWNESDGERIYDVTQRTELGDPIPYGDTTLYFALRPDGKQLAVPNGPSGLALWDVDPSHWTDAACSVAGRDLTHQEWDQYLGWYGDYDETCTHGHANS